MVKLRRKMMVKGEEENDGEIVNICGVLTVRMEKSTTSMPDMIHNTSMPDMIHNTSTPDMTHNTSTPDIIHNTSMPDMIHNTRMPDMCAAMRYLGSAASS